MIAESVLLGLAAALGAGLLVGIERERRKGTGPHRALAGVRTFALTALAGAGAQLTGHRVLVIAGAALLVLLTAIGYWRQRSRDPGITTEVALFITYVIGVIAMSSPSLAAGAAVVITALLASRSSLHRFSVEVLSQAELRDGLIFCGAALVMLPLLPDQSAGWLPAVNPRRFWGLVVLFMALQAAGYVALRGAGPRLGLALSGLASGFVSSTATIAALGARAREAPELRSACVSGALCSTVATVVLLAVVAATVSPDGLRLLGPSLIAGLIAAVAAAAVTLRRRAGKAADSVPSGRAFNLLYAVGFAALLSTLTAAMAYATSRFGQLAVPLGTALAGFFDVHAAAASALSVTATTSPLPSQQIVRAVLLAVTTNTASKLVAAVSAGGLAYGARVAAGLILVVLAMWAPLLWLRI
ncbi:MAG TPA: DUF4010 domain-containing protein [Steroidobacteraceae bacterium]|nr:DUF4010 domain-containing protein [Steroidobacteraceae bacterium]